MTPPKTLTVKVTQKHIDEGTRGSCSRCPLAQAVSEISHGAAVFDGVEDHICAGSVEYRHTIKSLKFINDVDLGRPVSPATFRFRRIDP